MTLFKLALKNIAKSVKDYTIYFFTLVVGVIIFYVFNAIDSQTAMMNVSKSTYDIINLMNAFLNGVSVFVAIVLGALIIYASNFLIKRRKKEFGVYLTLGMGKRKMSAILLTETMIIGAVSLAAGLLLGCVLSQFMSIAVANIFEADMSGFTFVFSGKAAIKTVIYFGVMYLIVMIFNTISVGRCKLIDLLQGARKSENFKFRNPYICLTAFLLACVGLAWDYHMVLKELDSLFENGKLVTVLIVGAVSTFLIFWSISGSILSVAEKIKGLYYKNLNSFVLRQFGSKINTMVMSMTVICLMLFLTILLLGSAIGLTHSLNSNIRDHLPSDVNINRLMDESKEDVITTLENNGFDTTIFKNVTTAYFYDPFGITMGDTMREYIADPEMYYVFVRADAFEKVTSVSEYNKIAKVFGSEKIELHSGEYACVADLGRVMDARTNAMKDGVRIVYNGVELKPGYDHCVKGTYVMNINECNEGVIIVPDELVNDEMITENRMFADYNVSKDEINDTDERVVSEIVKLYSEGSVPIGISTKADLKASSVGLGALATFISLYVGIIFLVASAAILSLKELSESSDNVEKYAVLRRIGVDEKMLDKALFAQMGMFFIFPMIIAGIHSIFGLKTTHMIFETFQSITSATSIVITAIIIVSIYGGYFLVTYFTGRRIIRGR